MAVATTTLLVTAIGLAAVSAGVGAYASVSAGQARSDAAKYNAAVAKNNARASQEQANFEANRIRDRNRRFAAKQRNAVLASGITLSGTSQDLIADSATQGELDVLSVLYTGDVASMNQKARAKLFGLEADDARRAGKIGAASSLLGGASSAASSYVTMSPDF